MASKRAEDYIDSKIKPKVTPVVGGLSRIGQAPLPKLNPAPATTTSYVGGRSLPAKTTAPASVPIVTGKTTAPASAPIVTGVGGETIPDTPPGAKGGKGGTGGGKDFDTNALYQSVLNAKESTT